MRGEWYGDKRDIVKWIRLAELAREGDRNRRILQVTMNTFDRCTDLEGLDMTDSVTGKVIDYFYDLQDVKRLGGTLGIDICVFEEQFLNEPCQRSGYFNRVCDRIKKLKKDDTKPIVVFLDPDTGIEPPSGHDNKHVRKSELKRIFDLLEPGDYLACYQHKPQFAKGVKWQTTAQQSMKGALAIDLEVTTLVSTYAGDSIVLAVQKGRLG